MMVNGKVCPRKRSLERNSLLRKKLSMTSLELVSLWTHQSLILTNSMWSCTSSSTPLTLSWRHLLPSRWSSVPKWMTRPTFWRNKSTQISLQILSTLSLTKPKLSSFKTWSILMKCSLRWIWDLKNWLRSMISLAWRTSTLTSLTRREKRHTVHFSGRPSCSLSSATLTCRPLSTSTVIPMSTAKLFCLKSSQIGPSNLLTVLSSWSHWKGCPLLSHSSMQMSQGISFSSKPFGRVSIKIAQAIRFFWCQATSTLSVWKHSSRAKTPKLPWSMSTLIARRHKDSEPCMKWKISQS